MFEIRNRSVRLAAFPKVVVQSAPLFHNWQLLTVFDILLVNSVHLVQVCLMVLAIICEYLSVP